AYATGDYAGAADRLEEAFRLEPAAVFLLELVYARRALTEYKAAMRDCLKLSGMFPESPEAEQAREMLPQLEANYRSQQESAALRVPLPSVEKEKRAEPPPPPVVAAPRPEPVKALPPAEPP